LSRGDLALDYFLGGDSSYVWIVTSNSRRVIKLARQTDLEKLANAVVERFEQAALRKKDPRLAAEFSFRLKTLAKALGIAESLVGREVRRVVIIPDGILHRVPFAALPEGEPGRPLGVEYELVQAPSASAFKLFRQRRVRTETSTPSMTAFVDPVFDGLDSRVRRPIGSELAEANSTRSELYLPRLALTRMEVDHAQTVLTGLRMSISDGFNASKEVFLAPRTWKSTVVLVSTHALVNDLRPELSSIVLSRVDAEGRAVDGMVWLYDIDGLTISGSLVVLSTCDAANGRREDGEGLISFARSFLNAGASGLVAPVSRVDEVGTATLIGLFVRGIVGPRQSPAMSLKAARSDLAKSNRWKDPYYWASFVLLGGWD
jgi:CHAT domain-containing protein